MSNQDLINEMVKASAASKIKAMTIKKQVGEVKGYDSYELEMDDERLKLKRVIVHRPCKRTVSVLCKGLKTYKIQLPWMVFAQVETGAFPRYKVALCLDEVENIDCQIYWPPFQNIHKDMSVCMPAGYAYMDLESFIDNFWGSIFNTDVPFWGNYVRSSYLWSWKSWEYHSEYNKNFEKRINRLPPIRRRGELQTIRNMLHSRSIDFDTPKLKAGILHYPKMLLDSILMFSPVQ